MIQLQDKLYHKDCFKCAHCKQLLTGNWCKYEGNPYCNEDYQKLFLPKCAKCNNILTTAYVKCIGKCWHPECLTCFKCNKPVGQCFDIIDDNPYCTNCSH